MGKNTAMSQEQALRIFQGCDQVAEANQTKTNQTEAYRTKANQIKPDKTRQH